MVGPILNSVEYYINYICRMLNQAQFKGGANALKLSPMYGLVCEH